MTNNYVWIVEEFFEKWITYGPKFFYNREDAREHMRGLKDIYSYFDDRKGRVVCKLKFRIKKYAQVEE